MELNKKQKQLKWAHQYINYIVKYGLDIDIAVHDCECAMTDNDYNYDSDCPEVTAEESIAEMKACAEYVEAGLCY